MEDEFSLRIGNMTNPGGIAPRPEQTAGSESPRVICIGDVDSMPKSPKDVEIVQVDGSVAVVDELKDPSVTGVYIDRECLPQLGQLRGISKSYSIFRDMPDGVALIDSDLKILWANRRLGTWTQTEATELVGSHFYRALGDPEIMGPDFCPFHTALATGEESNSTLQCKDNTFYQVHAAPLDDMDAVPQLIVTISDITKEILQKQKLEAIHQAGRSLADMQPNEISFMGVPDRIELLKEKIREYLKDLLEFDVIEIRLLEQTTEELVPLLSVGIDQEASDRQLSAHPKGNGVTGFVAAKGRSYICHDVENDPLFIPGVQSSRSSITVPLILHDQILGTLNVESPEPNAFHDEDVQFLEIFARDVAFALNTLELLVAQKADTAQQSCTAIHSAVALPVDEILNDAVIVLENYLGHTGEFGDRLRRILENARDIKQTIQRIGREMTPVEANPAEDTISDPELQGKRILVVDADPQVREDAHRLLERYGCIVETAHHGDEAVSMVRSGAAPDSYHVIVSDIKLPDYSGYQLMRRLGVLMDEVPMVLMTAFGYDPGHSIVKARQAGLHSGCTLFKPFRMDQLIQTVKTALGQPGVVICQEDSQPEAPTTG